MRLPQNQKTALARGIVSWIAAFPTITILLAILDPLMTGWPLIVRTFLLVSLMVPIMSLVTPLLLKGLSIFTRQSNVNEGTKKLC